jgi:fatty acid desaturase
MTSLPKPQVNQFIKELRIALSSASEKSLFRSLHQRLPVRVALAFLFDWLLIILSVLLASQSLLFFPVSLLLIGSRQRALSNLVHDASHGNLFSNRKMNDFFANFFSAYAVFETVGNYRRGHLKHHQFLGLTGLDPDTDSHLRYGFDDSKPRKEPPFSLYVSLILSPSSWKDSVFGQFTQLSFVEKAQVFVWWGVILGSITLVAGLSVMFLFLFLWIVARGTSYHAIRVFAEFLDHTGLPVGSSLSFTRNLPHRGLFSSIVHPHEDTYHLIHHLFPRIPHHQLRQAHQVLNQSSVYLRAHHCDSYFFGQHSAVSCWIGLCNQGFPWA